MFEINGLFYTKRGDNSVLAFTHKVNYGMEVLNWSGYFHLDVKMFLDFSLVFDFVLSCFLQGRKVE